MATNVLSVPEKDYQVGFRINRELWREFKKQVREDGFTCDAMLTLLMLRYMSADKSLTKYIEKYKVQI